MSPLRAFSLVMLIGMVPSSGTNWAPIAAKANPSIVYVESTKGSCSGGVIDDDAKGDRDRILVAAHCEGDKLFADSLPARVIFKDTKHDLMVVDVEDTGRPAIAVAKENPHTGDEVGSYGHGLALERPMFRHAYVSDDAAKIPELEGGPFIMIDAGYVHGQSGGPVINTSGEIVAIVQYATELIGIGVGAETIRSKVGRYLAKGKP